MFLANLTSICIDRQRRVIMSRVEITSTIHAIININVEFISQQVIIYFFRSALTSSKQNLLVFGRPTAVTKTESACMAFPFAY